jgi:hypothetical protein
MNDDRALVRALRIERASRKMCEQRLRALMAPDEYAKFLRFCRAKVHAGRAEPILQTPAAKPGTPGGAVNPQAVGDA